MERWRARKVAIVGEAGVERAFHSDLPAAEQAALERSGGIRKQAIAQLGEAH